MKLLYFAFLPFVAALPAPDGTGIGGESGSGAYRASYDYIVVGGGTAGLTIAARLAENPSLTIAVIEAGDFYENLNGNKSIVPGYDVSASIPGLTDWGVKTIPQPQLNNRTLSYNSAKVVGGSSMTNLMAFHRSTIDAFAKWADVVGDKSYTWDRFLPYYKKSTKYTPGSTIHRPQNATVPPLSPASTSPLGGPLSATFPNFAYPAGSYLGPAFNELGVAELPDLQSGELIGWQYSPFAITPGMERSGATAYLQYATAKGFTNLKLYKTTQGQKIIWEGKRAVGVQVKDKNGTVFMLGVKKEVIVSAGVFRTPQFLLLSGLGSPSTLSPLQIPLTHPLPGIGTNLQDHPFINIASAITLPSGSRLLSPTFAALQATLYKTNRTGYYTNPSADSFGWAKLPTSLTANMSAAAKKVLSGYPADWPDVEIVLVEAPFAAGGDYLMASCQVQSFISKGTVTINSTDISDQPVVDTNTMGESVDQEIALAALKYVRAFFATEAFRSVMVPGGDVVPGEGVQSDGEEMEWLRGNIGSGFHGTSTCAMGKKSDPMAVIDSKARVFGVKNVRVVDASSFPFVTPGHPAALVFALAEKIADDIKEGLKH